MIDGHVHAFPDLPSLAVKAVERGLGERASQFLERRVLPRLQRAASLLSERAKALSQVAPELGIERVAELKASLPPALHRWAETTGSVGMLAPVMASGHLRALDAAMARAQVTRVVLIGSAGIASNDWLLGEAREHMGQRAKLVATLPPLAHDRSERAWLEAYEDLARRGVAGLKIHANWDGVPADHASNRAVFEVAARHRLFVIVHTGCFHAAGYRQKAPVELEQFAPYFEEYPEVKVCLAHMNRDRPERAWAMMKRYEQVFTDTSWQTARNIRQAIDTVGAERIMLGSDWPLLHGDLIDEARRIVERATRGAEYDAVCHTAACRMFGELT